MESGSLNLPEPSGPHRPVMGILYLLIQILLLVSTLQFLEVQIIAVLHCNHLLNVSQEKKPITAGNQVNPQFAVAATTVTSLVHNVTDVLNMVTFILYHTTKSNCVLFKLESNLSYKEKYVLIFKTCCC
jgi:hypothetical protein